MILTVFLYRSTYLQPLKYFQVLQQILDNYIKTKVKIYITIKQDSMSIKDISSSIKPSEVFQELKKRVFLICRQFYSNYVII